MLGSFEPEDQMKRIGVTLVLCMAACVTTASGRLSSGGGGGGGGGPAAPIAGGDSELDRELTETLQSTSEECSKIAGVPITFTGKMAVDPDVLSVSACGNISDGLRYVCQDNAKSSEAQQNLAAKLAGLSTVVCEFAPPQSATAEVKIAGAAIHVWTNIEMPDPSERARCVIAQQLQLKYKGDLDKACLQRKY
jgi:hypothetical protein